MTRDLVLVGGGHAHVHVLRAFGMRPMADLRLTLVTGTIETPYSGMLPGYVAGHYTLDECHVDLAPLARYAGARLILAEAVGLDRDRRELLLRDRPPLRYDVVSFNTGATPGLAVPGAAEHAIPVKPIHRFARRWEALRARAEAAASPLRILVVGGGAGGVELALAVRHRLAGKASVALIAKGRLLTEHPAATRAHVLNAALRAGLEIRENAEVVAVQAGAVVLAGGLRLPADEILWVTEAAAPAWLAETGLARDERGFLAVDDTLRACDDAQVFAAGDVATVVSHPRAKAGVFAVRQGPPLAENLRRALDGRRLRPFHPQRRFLSLIGTSDGRAIASRGGLALEGVWAWRLKEWIDRRWMRMYVDLPQMPSRAMPPAEMRCGGCGAKIGATTLGRALARLPRRDRPDGVLLGLEERDDSAAFTVPPGLVLVQSVDFFRALVDDPFLFGRIAATHALGDLQAMGAAPHSALATAVVPHGDALHVEDDLAQMLAGAESVLAEAGAVLLGGHSSEGAELAFGLTVNGTAASEALLRKNGARPGDLLILTKPLGTGTIFAGGMHGHARGRWIAAALDAMTRSLAPAAGILRRHGARAMTDVTGFGLFGHALEMARASQAGILLDPGAAPVLDGALALFAQGVASTLQPENLKLAAALADDGGWRGTARFSLLFDPQTAGGLLAALPAGRADACLEALREAGETAAIVGAVIPAADPARPIALSPNAP